VPWCDACDRFLSPSTVKIDGTCPSCGRTVDPGHAHAVEQKSEAGADDDEDLPPIPWHLWLLLGALAVYLGYRAMQGIEWLVGVVHFH
jgi:PHP family Zn ribbon phosphoesterase